MPRSEGAPSRPKPSRTVIVLAVFAVLVVAVPMIVGFLGVMSITPAKTDRNPDPPGPAQSGVRELHFALRDYNRDLGTDTSPYPSDIHELESRGYIESVEDALAADDFPSGDWLYFSAADSTDTSAPLLISPLYSGKHIALRVDGSASDLTPQAVADFIAGAAIPPQRILVETKRPVKR